MTTTIYENVVPKMGPLTADDHWFDLDTLTFYVIQIVHPNPKWHRLQIAWEGDSMTAKAYHPSRHD